MHRRNFLAAFAAVVIGAKREFAMATGLKPEWIQHTRLPESDWVEEDLLLSRDLLASPASSTDEALYPEHPTYFQPGDILHCPRTGENMRVLGLTAIGLGLHVVRGVGCTPCAMVHWESIWILGSASHEGATSERVPVGLDEWPQAEREQFVEKASKIYQRGVKNPFADSLRPTRRPREWMTKKELEDLIGEPL